MSQMLLRAPDWLKMTIQKEAKHRGLSVNALALQILNDWAQRQQRPSDEAQEWAG